jgi:hypothetical protein
LVELFFELSEEDSEEDDDALEFDDVEDSDGADVFSALDVEALVEDRVSVL